MIYGTYKELERQGDDKNLHNEIIRTLASTLENQGYSIKADHIQDYPSPTEVNGHIPDIIATSFQKRIIVEVETCESISKEHTLSQFRAFSNTGSEFHVTVPDSCLDTAKHQVRDWNIRVDHWWRHLGA